MQHVVIYKLTSRILRKRGGKRYKKVRYNLRRASRRSIVNLDPSSRGNNTTALNQRKRHLL